MIFFSPLLTTYKTTPEGGDVADMSGNKKNKPDVETTGLSVLCT